MTMNGAVDRAAPIFNDSIHNEMMQQKEQLMALIRQSSEKKPQGKFKYASESPLEVTFKDFLALEPEVARSAKIVTGTSTDVIVKSPDYIDCSPENDLMRCSVVTGQGQQRDIGTVMGVSNFKNTRMVPRDESFVVVSSKSAMRCVAEKGMVLFCIGY